MKSVITAICLLIPLVILFVLIDRKDFYSGDDVALQQETVREKKTITETTLKPVEKPAEIKLVAETKSLAETKPVAETKPAETKAVETMPVVEKKPVETKPADVKPVTETRPVTESKPTEVKPTEVKSTETKPAETKPVAETMPIEGKLAPAAIPVVTLEEAEKLNSEALVEFERREKIREEAQKRGIVFYEELFTSTKYLASKNNISIQQTPNWRLVQKNDALTSDTYAKKQDGFVIKSETPLEYVFTEPLLEHTIYCYTLACSVKGEGRITLSKKGDNTPQSFSINSKTYETFFCELGDGTSLNTKITPAITFQGNLQVETITIFQKEIKKHWTVCTGTIEKISSVPDIEEANYPDCYYTAELVVKDIFDGDPAPQRIQLLIPAFLNGEIAPLSKTIKKGDWKVSIRPFSLASKEEQEIEQVDEIETYLYAPYILNAATRTSIPELTVSGIPILEGEAYVSPFDNPINSPLPDRFTEDSAKEIEKELAKVSMIVESVDDKNRINEEFQSAWNEKQKQYDSLNSTMIWAKEQDSFFALPKKWNFIPSDNITETNVKAIAELNQFFKSQGIQFIIQIVPDYRDIAALVLNPAFQKYGDQRSARVAKRLLEQGVEVQYISDELVKNALKYELIFFYPNDFHPAEGTIETMTILMARRLEKFGDLLPKDLDPSSFSKENRNIGLLYNLKWPPNVNIGSHMVGTNYQGPFVLYNKEILESNPESKVLVFGNSFIQEPMSKNAYISFLAQKILHACSCKSMRGVSALTVLPQLFLSSPEMYLKDKRIAILPISIMYLTDNRYSFPSIVLADKTLKNANKIKYLVSLSLKKDYYPVFSSSFDFSYTLLPDYLPYRTSSIDLSRNRSKVSFPIPEGIKPNTARVSIQSLYNYGVSLFINGKQYQLPSRANPKWETIEIEIDTTDNSLDVELDFKNCSSPDAKILIGNVSLFE